MKNQFKHFHPNTSNLNHKKPIKMKPNTNPILKSTTRRPSRWRAALVVAAFTAILAGGIVPVRASTVPITLTIQGAGNLPRISPVLNGFSTEVGGIAISNVDYNPTGYFWAATNTQLVQLFQNVNFKMIRIGGNSADDTRGPLWPADADIDTAMGFANACGMKVIYQLNLENGNENDNRIRSAYLWNNYPTLMYDVGIGNEPNLYTTGSQNPMNIIDWPSYITVWDDFYSAVANASTNAVYLGGPDASNGGSNWVTMFATSKVSSAHVTDLHYHYAPCGRLQPGETTYQQDQAMLAPDMDSFTYSNLLSNILGSQTHFAWDFTEFNGNISDGNFHRNPTNNSQTSFGEALFILDALHWWGEHGLSSLDVYGEFNVAMSGPNNQFHQMFYYDTNGTLQACAPLYGCKAFDIGGGGGGQPINVVIDNPNSLNIMAYDVRKNNNHYITIINRQLGTGEPDASVSISSPPGYTVGTISRMDLVQQNIDVTAPTGVTLGGDVITGTNVWNGTWTPLSSLNNIIVSRKTATIVRLTP